MIYLYLIVGIFAIIASVSSVSRGLMFTDKVKFVTLCLLILAVVITSIITIINYTWWHIIWLIVEAVVVSWIISFLWCTIFYKGEY
jgi:hypothetical protein